MFGWRNKRIERLEREVARLKEDKKLSAHWETSRVYRMGAMYDSYDVDADELLVGIANFLITHHGMKLRYQMEIPKSVVVEKKADGKSE